MITDVEEYFALGCGRCPRFETPECSTQIWSEGLAELRRVCLGAGLEETAKWGHPCYMAAGRNIAIIGAFQQDFRLTFFNAGLMKDPEGVLEKQGENTRFPDAIRFKGADAVRTLEPVIGAYLQEAVGYAEAGLRNPTDDREIGMAVELAEALAADVELSEAWDALTPGRRKSYLLNLNSAKKPETRVNRIARFRDKIMQGKGALER